MWEQIRSNQTKSMMLVVALGVLLLVLGFALGYAFLDNGIIGLVVALVIWFFMNLFAYFQGGSMVLAISGARKIGPDDHPRLWNVVEEMKISSGLEKMPDVYIIDDPALNAFATGRDPNHAAVAVTSGLLQKMNRDELQGVVAHELSHIKNRDVLLMTLCSVTLGTIVILAWYGTRVMIFSGGGRRRNGGSGAAIIMIVALVLAILAPILAQLIYYAVSRKREYLADASGALYTRYPEGLASALEKISGSTVQLKSANQAFAPMYTANPFRKKGKAAEDLTSTHPPISERIRILRNMAGGANFKNYQEAFSSVRGSNTPIIPGSGMADQDVIGLRSGSAGQETGSDKRGYNRELGDIMKTVDQYQFIQCSCGLKLKIPPAFTMNQVQCPKCGTNHIV